MDGAPPVCQGTNSYEYLFGYEESYGCLFGTYARDKDGIAAVMELCEVACFAISNDKTLCDNDIQSNNTIHLIRRLHGGLI